MGGVEMAATKGTGILKASARNRDTAFTLEERRSQGLEGLLPAAVETLEQQEARALAQLRAKPDDYEKYFFLAGLQRRNDTLFYRLLMGHTDEIMPLVYTPTVGKVCQLWSRSWRGPNGLYILPRHKGRIREVLDNWPEEDVRVIVVTDGERILGLGDQGANGMGIPVGKLSLYVSCAGIDPRWTLPVTLDVGTENLEYREDPFYIGLRQPRLRGQEYDDFVEEFMLAASEKWPGVLIQFEDFANQNAFRLLEKFRKRMLCFNDDIQGTGAVALSGFLSALQVTGKPLEKQRILFLGAGEAATGIGSMLAAGMKDLGYDESTARSLCWFYDSKGLVVESRSDLNAHKAEWAQKGEFITSFEEAIRKLKPTAIIGASGQGGAFTPAVLKAMAEINERPIVFALSNPTSKAECSGEAAYEHTQGRAIFASGSPFPPVEWNGRMFVPGQGNNAYIFPGIGLGVLAAKAHEVTDEMFFAAAKRLAELVESSDLEIGRVYPPLSRIREVSLEIAMAVAEQAWKQGVAGAERPDDVRNLVRALVWEPDYLK
jgi:malate dehydrogenase (oxaloacetate-decarboxylating)(NADP+)